MLAGLAAARIEHRLGPHPSALYRMAAQAKSVGLRRQVEAVTKEACLEEVALEMEVVVERPKVGVDMEVAMMERVAPMAGMVRAVAASGECRHC